MSAVIGCAAAVPGARLFIHSDETTDVAGSRLMSWLERMHVLPAPWTRVEPLSLSVEDSRGRTVFAIADAGALVELPLAPGTYHVTAHRGRSRRGYTLTLESGMSFDLHLSRANA